MAIIKQNKHGNMSWYFLLRILLAVIVILPMLTNYQRVWDKSTIQQTANAKTILLNTEALVSLKGSATIQELLDKPIRIEQDKKNKNRLKIIDNSGLDFAKIIPFYTKKNQETFIENNELLNPAFSVNKNHLEISSTVKNKPQVNCENNHQQKIKKIAFITNSTEIQNTIRTWITKINTEVRKDENTDADVLIYIIENNKNRSLVPHEWKYILCDKKDTWNVIEYQDPLQKPNKLVIEYELTLNNITQLLNTIGDTLAQ